MLLIQTSTEKENKWGLSLNTKSYLITHEAQLLSLWCKHNGTY